MSVPNIIFFGKTHVLFLLSEMARASNVEGLPSDEARPLPAERSDSRERSQAERELLKALRMAR